MSMRQAWRLNVAVIAVMTLALLGGWETYQGITQGTPPAWAADDDRDRDRDRDRDGDKDRCDTELLAGSYGFNAEGAVVDLQSDRAKDDKDKRDDVRLFAAIGVITLYEDGTLTVTVREILHGVPEPRRETFAGTYSVEPECLGTAEFADSSWDFVAVNNGNEIYLATTERGTVITADAKRLFKDKKDKKDMR